MDRLQKLLVLRIVSVTISGLLNLQMHDLRWRHSLLPITIISRIKHLKARVSCLMKCFSFDAKRVASSRTPSTVILSPKTYFHEVRKC